MKLDKAIEILTIINHPDNWEIFPDDIDAIKLGIEALKKVKAIRDKEFPVMGEELPGETID